MTRAEEARYKTIGHGLAYMLLAVFGVGMLYVLVLGVKAVARALGVM